MDRIEHLLHPGLMPDVSAHWRNQGAPVHLRQGQLENRSDFYSLLTGLIIIGTTTTTHLLGLAKNPKGDPLEDLWHAGGQGAMEDLLAKLPDDMCHTLYGASTTATLAFAVGRVGRGDVVILRCVLDGLRDSHWVVAVGLERRTVGAKRIVTAILTLDSCAPAPSVSATNGRLEIFHPLPTGRCRHYRSTAGGVSLYRVNSAVALWRKQS